MPFKIPQFTPYEARASKVCPYCYVRYPKGQIVQKRVKRDRKFNIVCSESCSKAISQRREAVVADQGLYSPVRGKAPMQEGWFYHQARNKGRGSAETETVSPSK